jgi:iron complex transport system ATP-binding protein
VTTIQITDVSVSFNGTKALNDVSVAVPSGTWLGLIGPNGSGKTTLLRAVAGLVGKSGEITLGDDGVSALGRRGLARLVAYVPQRPWIPSALPVVDYVLMGRTPYISYFGTETPTDLDVVGEVLERLELTAFAARSLGSLSGGELQRVVLARALAQQAPVLLLDEPTSALDVGHQQHALELVDALRRERSLTVMSAMHDLTLAGQFADSLVLLDGGRAVAAGPAHAILTEDTIRDHYGASVRVLEDPDGGVLVFPIRRRDR